MYLKDKEYITYRMQRRADNIFHSESEEEEDLGVRNEPPEGSTMSILNDLARRQQQLVRLLTQLITSNQGNQNNAGNNGSGGTNGNNGNNGNHAEGSNTYTPPQNNTWTTSRVTLRPLLPQFLEEQEAGNQGQQGLG